MKTMAAVAAIGLIGWLGLAGRAEAVPSTTCFPGPGGSVKVTQTGVGVNEIPASALGDGYNNNQCDVTIAASIPINLPVSIYRIIAKTLVVQGPDTSPTGLVEIINLKAAGDVQIATTGNIKIDQASVKAKDKVEIFCSAPLCTVTVTGSELIASSTVNGTPGGGFGGPGGILLVTAGGNLSVSGTTVWAGELVRLNSVNGSTTLLCTAGGTGCKDPNARPIPAIIKDQCGDPIVFPCKPVFDNAAELREVCFGVTPVNCGGGSSEFDILAKVDVHIEDTVISATSVMTISAANGRIFGKGADITALKLSVGAKGNSALSPVVDFKDASIIVTDSVRIDAKGCAPAPNNICVDLTGAVLEADPIAILASSGNGVVRVCKNGNPGTGGVYTETGGGFPSINGIGSPPYTKNTKASDADCTPDKGGTFN